MLENTYNVLNVQVIITVTPSETKTVCWGADLTAVKCKQRHGSGRQGLKTGDSCYWLQLPVCHSFMENLWLQSCAHG